MAVSFRWVARSNGFWWLHFNRLSKRPTSAEWYDTRNSRWIRTATRGCVQTSPRNSKCSAPWASSLGSWANCSSLKRGLGPPLLRWCSASAPCLFEPLANRFGLTPNFSAISFCFQPFWLSSHARKRQASRQPTGRWFVFLSIGPSVPHFARSG